jgi:hypothetical protein
MSSPSQGQRDTQVLGKISFVVLLLVGVSQSAMAVSTETSNGCMSTQDDPCIRSGSCEIQGAVWDQVVTIDRSDIFDTQGWPGLCDMVHVGLVQGTCEPPGALTNVTVHISETSSAFVPSIVGPLACAGEAEPAPPPKPVPAIGAVGRFGTGALLGLLFLRMARALADRK